MYRTKKSFFSFLLLGALLLFTPQLIKAAIFGTDDRELVSPYSVDYVLARSTAVGVLNSLIIKNESGNFRLLPDPISDLLCKDQKFATQPSISYACSGFLVGPDLLATAGHCSVNTGETNNEPGMYCEAYSSWVFGYSTDHRGLTNTDNVPSDNNYNCKQIVYAVSDKENDYALIQLDRPVKGRQPLNLNPNALNKNQKLKMIGHPFGLPTIVSKNARILKNDLRLQTIQTNLDALSGNSGSAVFNEKNEVIGILISGSPINDTVSDKILGCGKYNYCDERGGHCLLPDLKNDGSINNYNASDVQRIAPLVEKIKEFEKSRQENN